MQKLTEFQINEALTKLKSWSFTDGTLTRTWTFQDFAAAIAFVNQVAEKAESAGHHPDIDIRYNKVKLALVTHDAGGITENDVNMAFSMDSVS